MKIRAKQNISTDLGDGSLFFATQGQVIDEVNETLAKRLIKDGLAVEYKPDKARAQAAPVAKTVWVRALINIHRFNPHVWLQEGHKGKVSEAVADELVKLGQAVKTTAPPPKPAEPQMAVA
ncbi:MAG: hypothetical protein KTR15_00445 [Phycisphaeraceae bacterium]|nr:hypothetical protein [Phycisphaeraceae bacterium]